MEVVKGLRHYNSKKDYDSNRKKTFDGQKVEKEKSVETAEKSKISKQAKKLVKDGAKSVASNLITTGLKSVGSALTRVPVPILATDKKDEVKSVVAPEKGGVVDSPSVIFISGFKLAGISGDEDSGVKKMANAIPGAKHFSWDEQDQILKELKNHSYGSPIVLVGHSLGGDSAVEIANKLNSLENGFQKVDLLVTLDSVGIDNDIIPINVKKNMNFISDMDLIFNDGPNIARDSKGTVVINELRDDDHTSLDDSSEVQSKIFNSIQSTIFSMRASKLAPILGENLQLHNG